VFLGLLAKNIFLSFDDVDLNRVRIFRAQVKSANNELEFKF